MKTQLEERLQRTIALLGKEKAERVFGASVMVIGCGAVGGYALEMVARLGFGKIRAVDFDRFEASNINRQILATISTIGCKSAKRRASGYGRLIPMRRFGGWIYGLRQTISILSGMKIRTL